MIPTSSIFMIDVKSNKLEEFYSKLFSDGKLVQLHIEKWSMAAPIEPADLKIKPNELFRLGVKRLIKTSVLNEFISLESRARRYLGKNAFDFPIAQAHFVPNKAILKVIDGLDEFKKEFTSLVETFVDSYEDYKKDMLDSYPDYKEILEPCYPPIDDIRPRFGFNYQMFEISVPKKLKEISLASIQAEKEAINDLKVKYSDQIEDQFKSGLNEMNGFLEEVVSSLRGKVISSFEHVIEKIRNRQPISKGNISTLKDVINSFKELNFINDDEVDSKLNEIHTLLESNYNFKENGEAIQALNTSLTRAVETARNVTTNAGRSYRRLLL